MTGLFLLSAENRSRAATDRAEGEECPVKAADRPSRTWSASVSCHLLVGHGLAAQAVRAHRSGAEVCRRLGTSPDRYWTTWNTGTATGPVRTGLCRLRNPAAGPQGQLRRLCGHYQDTARSFGRRPGRVPRVVIADGRTCVRRPTPASSRWTCPLWLSRFGGAGHRCCWRVAPLRKSSIGSVAAPSATASGPSWPSSIDAAANGCRSECRWADSRIAGSSLPPSSRPAQPPRMTRSGWNKLIRLPMPTPRYSAVSARTASVVGDESAAMSAASLDSSSPADSAARPPHWSRIASAPTYASRQPADPHRQRLPPTTIVVCPHSATVEVGPW